MDDRAMSVPIVDLHCDLLHYLVDKPGRSADDTAPRCGLPLLKEGGVVLQVMAIFTITGPQSVALGTAQGEVFEQLLRSRQDVLLVDGLQTLARLPVAGRVGVVAAVENASGFCAEDEPLAAGLERFEALVQRVRRVLYVSLTWNGENRFGGGNSTDAGLKADGRRLLERLAGRGIALDLSHACHRLASEALEHIDAAGLDLPVMASHSCFQALCDLPRNLPDDIAREIITRGGVIGLNFMRRFLGPGGSDAFAAHVEHALALHGAASYGFGADFFAAEDLPSAHAHELPFFPPGFDDARCYPRLLDLLGDRLPAAAPHLADLAHGNVLRYVSRLWQAH